MSSVCLEVEEWGVLGKAVDNGQLHCIVGRLWEGHRQAGPRPFMPSRNWAPSKGHCGMSPVHISETTVMKEKPQGVSTSCLLKHFFWHLLHFPSTPEALEQTEPVTSGGAGWSLYRRDQVGLGRELLPVDLASSRKPGHKAYQPEIPPLQQQLLLMSFT